MLKVYNATRFISVNHGEWKQLGWSYDIMMDDAPDEIMMVEQMSFDEFYKRLEDKSIPNIYCGKTLFHKKPKIRIEYDIGHTKRYTNFDSISYKVTYEEIKNCSLYSIMRAFPAEQTIQYLKERGITTCPMNF